MTARRSGAARRAAAGDSAAEALAEYGRKRDFGTTAEPPPGAPYPAAATGPRFVVQKHAATRLHYDLRLEIDGVLKSWALTRAPSLDPANKRLAVRTEDHPLAYAAFEGTIPRDQYGGGTMMLWDEGSYRVDGADPARALAEGKLHLHMAGSRLTGEWALVRLPPRGRGSQESWLFLKAGPRQPVPPKDLEERFTTSISTGRTMEAIAAGRPARKARERPRPVPPAFRAFQLCGRAEAPPAGAGWLHEIKHDGYRAQVALGGGDARIRLRGGGDATGRLPTLAAALAGLTQEPALLDGELVVQDAEGRSSFGLLQQALAAGDDRPILFVAFDLLTRGDRRLDALPLAERKAALRAWLDETAAPARSPVLLSDHLEGDAADLLAEACALGLEGLISKRADSPYRCRRSNDWLKVKCARSEPFLIIGWLPSRARGIRSLLLARKQGEELAYAGKVGTGFSADEMERLAGLLQEARRDRPPVRVPAAAARGARWVEPRLVGRVGYTETTADGALRHPVWHGLEDKPVTPGSRAAPPRPAPLPVDRPPTGVAISNADRIIFPEAGCTKGDLAAYVSEMAPMLLAHAGRRPLSLVRCPGGVQQPCFFQKHWHDGLQHVHQTRADREGKRWIYVEEEAGLVGCVQMGSIEFHGWGSRVGALDRPDRLVIDLDPDEALPFPATVEAALEVRDQLSAMGLLSFPLLSGGKGVHVVAPLDGSRRWPAVKDFARRFALALEAARPERYIASARKAGREGRIFVDWMRNQKGATAIMPWSVRARPHAPVAVPVDWPTLEETPIAGAFTLGDRPRILAQARMLRGWGEADQALPAH